MSALYGVFLTPLVHFVLKVIVSFESLCQAQLFQDTRNMCEEARLQAFQRKKNYKARTPRLTVLSSLQGRVSMLVCNLLN